MVDHASRYHRRMGIGGLCGVGAGMMDKHTPGPWRLGKKWDSVVADGETGYDDDQTLKAYGGHLVCESAKHKPNAHIIAAAPDLLAALEAMRDHPTIRAVCPSPLWAQMVNAILKARGETA
jgi:hypothetical protein